ncbi:MAG: hypothetical protein ACR2KP_12595 [Egibacteraceae bacterium]
MLSGIHVMRNPHLYTRCWQAGLVSDLGSGVSRADRAVREALGEDLIIEISEQETVVIIPRRI